MTLKTKNLAQRNPYPHDRSIRVAASLIAAYIVTEYGGSEPLLPRLLDPDYYVEFGSTWLITLLDIQWIYLATRWLDIRYDWHRATIFRLPLQLLLGILLPTIFTFLLAAAYFAFYHINILKTNYHLYALPFIVLLISLFNGYYYVRYLLAERESAGNQRAVAMQVPPPSAEDREQTIFLAQTPTRTIKIPVTDIAYFFRERGHVYVRLSNGMDHLLAQSLEQIEAATDSRMFFRAARYAIVSRNAIAAFRSLDYGKLGLSLKPEYKETVVVSKLLARDFKKWLSQ